MLTRRELALLASGRHIYAFSPRRRRWHGQLAALFALVAVLGVGTLAAVLLVPGW